MPLAELTDEREHAKIEYLTLKTYLCEKRENISEHGLVIVAGVHNFLKIKQGARWSA